MRYIVPKIQPDPLSEIYVVTVRFSNAAPCVERQKSQVGIGGAGVRTLNNNKALVNKKSSPTKDHPGFEPQGLTLCCK